MDGNFYILRTDHEEAMEENCFRYENYVKGVYAG